MPPCKGRTAGEVGPLTGHGAMASALHLFRWDGQVLGEITGKESTNANSPLDHMVDKLLSNDVIMCLTFCRTFEKTAVLVVPVIGDWLLSTASGGMRWAKGDPMAKKQIARRSAAAGRLILGIDPGVALVGYALVAEQQGRLESLACDVIATPAGMPLQRRLQMIYECLSQLILTYHPEEAAVESLFFGLNKKTAMAVGHARGVIMLALANGGLTIAEYTPAQVKLAVTGHGDAKKQQVGEMVRVLLGLSSVPRPDDAADAAAVAICHAHASQMRLLLKSQETMLVPGR